MNIYIKAQQKSVQRIERDHRKANSKDDKHAERCSHSCILKEMQIKMVRKHFFFTYQTGTRLL